MKARYDPQNSNRVIFQNTNYMFAIPGAIFAVLGIGTLILAPGFYRLGGLFFLVFGFGFLAVSDFNRIIVDGDRKTLEIIHRTLFRHSVETYPWDDFSGVGFQAQTGDSGWLVRLAFFKKDGGAIPLNDSYDNLDLTGKKRDLEILSDLTRLPIEN